MKFKLKVTSQYLYYYILILLLVNNWWGDLRVFQGVYQLVKPAVLGIAIIMSFTLALKGKYTFAELCTVILLILIGTYTAYQTGSKWTLYSMILVAFAKNIDIEKTIKIIYICMSFFVLLAVSIFIVQYFFEPSSMDVYRDVSVVKYSMTFTSANEAARYWVFWFMLFVYINMGSKTSVLKKLLIVSVTIVFYVCTLSDTLLLILILALLKTFNSRKRFRRIIERFAGYSFGIIGIFSLAVLKFKGSCFFEIINKFMTGRLTLGIHGFETYGVSVLGQQGLEFYQWIKTGENTGYRLVVDNAYYMIMIQYGIFYVVLISVLFFKAKKRLDYRSACCLVAYAIYALAANTILSPTAIFPVVIAANLSWKPRKEHLTFNEHIKSTA